MLSSLDKILQVHEMLVENFPAEETVSIDDLINGVDSGITQIHTVEASDGITALAITDTLTSSVTLLSYLATRKGCRSSGLGGALLDSIMQTHKGLLFLTEVEHPDHHKAHDVYGDPLARLAFYGRKDAMILDLPYFQPPLSTHSEAVYGMLLLALNPSFHQNEKNLMEAGALRGALAALVEGVDPDNYPVGEMMLPTLSPDGVRLLPVGEFSQAQVFVP